MIKISKKLWNKLLVLHQIESFESDSIIVTHCHIFFYPLLSA